MHSVVRMACVYTLLGITPTYAMDYIHNYVPEAKMVGQGRAQILIWDVYDATLYAPSGVYMENRPFALKLKYLQDLTGRSVADHAVREMRRLGYTNEVKLAAWHDRMIHIFPDVVPGNIVTGIFVPDGPTIFYKDGKEAGRIEDKFFGREFFRIWFDVRTSTPDLRQSLLNAEDHMKGYKNETPENSDNFGGGHDS